MRAWIFVLVLVGCDVGAVKIGEPGTDDASATDSDVVSDTDGTAGSDTDGTAGSDTDTTLVDDTDVVIVGDATVDDDHDTWTDAQGDCNDANASVHPGAVEIPDGIDQDCDGVIDEGTTAWDDDGDCFCEVGPCAGSTNASCQQILAGDCNDGSGAVSPHATESCNGVDDNCDGRMDEAGALGSTSWYRDQDGDHYGDLNQTVSTCRAPQGYVSNSDDCYDLNNDAHPGATFAWYDADRGDGSFDYNCDGLETERYTTTYSCRAECQGGTVEGWIGPVPACGDQGTWGSSCNQTNNGPNFCEPDSTRTRTQTCQ